MSYFEKSGNILVQRPYYQKVKTLYFLKLLKLKKIKCLYFFKIWLIGQDMAIFWLKMSFFLSDLIKSGHILVQRPYLEEKKDTLFSQSFKVKESKVPLCFSNFAHRPRYGQFLAKMVFFWQLSYKVVVSWSRGHIMKK